MSRLIAARLASAISGSLTRNVAEPSRCISLSRCYSSAAAPVSALDVARKYTEGDKIHGFTVNKVTEIPELLLVSVSLEHDKTHAQYLHVARDDNNNTFSIAFRTNPMDSTGVSHALEHTVLCGSQKFPVRDPFFKMLTRSMATYMNALTASDWTMYPFSTQNHKDYENLLDIYLDAVFNPRLTEMDFSQEGYRLEHSDPQDPTSPIVFKGVVFNEMKGVFSNPQNRYVITAMNRLMPTNTYGVVSGGDPMCMVDLTYDKLKTFHETHYHPSNSRMFSYGTFLLDGHLKFINENFLSKFERSSPVSKVEKEHRWDKPRESHIVCQHDPMAADKDKQTIVSVSYLLSEITDHFEAFTLSIIGTLLVEGENSPFYQNLIEANIGADYSPNVGYDSNTFESSFAVGLQGIKAADVDMVKEIINTTIQQVIDHGFEQDQIKSVLNQIELALKHQTSDFGLNLALAASPLWNHDGDPTEVFQINKHLERFKQELSDNPKYLQQKVQQYFKSNEHQLVLSMAPDAKFEFRRQEVENEKLAECVSRLSEADKEKVLETGKKLLSAQMADIDVSCLPTLKVSDIDKECVRQPLSIHKINDVDIYCSEQPTNGVTYFRAVSNLAAIPLELKHYIPLFCNVITKMGAGLYDYKQLSRQSDLYTGGLNAQVHIAMDHSDIHKFEEGVLLSSYCLDRNFEKMLELWNNIFNGPDFKDEDRLKTLIRMSAAELAASLSGQGHVYASTHGSSSLTSTGRYTESYTGISQAKYLKRVAEMTNLKSIQDHLLEIGRLVLKKNNIRFLIGSTPEQMDDTKRILGDFIADLPGKPRHASFLNKDVDFIPFSSQTHIELPFSVNYVSKCYRAVPYTDDDFAKLRLLSKLLSSKYLHREVREKGGAYGSGAVCRDGIFYFMSYRDPNSLQTLEVFDHAVDWAIRAQFTDHDVEEARLSVFQEIDKPVPPGERGVTNFCRWISDDMRQRRRHEIVQTTTDDVVNVANKYLAPGNRPCSTTFIGPENAMTQKDDKWKVIKESVN